MNELIRQLARESHIDVYGLGKDRESWEAVQQAFAQLIVKKCIQIVENEASTYAEPVWAFELVNDIQEQFEL